MSLCKCLEKTENMVKDMLVASLKDKGKTISSFVDESQSGFTCKGLTFSSGGWEIILPLEFKYILKKADGTPDKRAFKYKTNLFPSFCPMCGKKMKKD